MRRTLPAILGFAALVLSPQAACTDEDEGLSPARVAALRESVEGTWEYTDGATTTQFRLTQSSRDFDPEDPHASLSLVGDAYACGNHGLVKPAGACIDVYHMPFDVEILVGPALEARGVLTSFGGSVSIDNTLWIKLGTTELEGELANDAVTLNQGQTKSLRRLQP